jgi:peptidoglycan hydrolase-like protein with peptidoglycan-binding domain
VPARPRAALLLLALALVSIAASGCGGGDSEEAAATGVEPLPATTGAAEPSPPPASPPVVVRIAKGKPIGPGTVGDHVAALQEALTELGYEVGKIDGAYGPQTRKAIIAFQRKYKLGTDGIVGQKTAKRLNKELAKARGSNS